MAQPNFINSETRKLYDQLPKHIRDSMDDCPWFWDGRNNRLGWTTADHRRWLWDGTELTVSGGKGQSYLPHPLTEQ